jgi:hypothetical protein
MFVSTEGPSSGVVVVVVVIITGNFHYDIFWFIVMNR